MASLKTEVIAHYSPGLKCIQCGFSDIRALTIDHINGGGNKERAQLKRRGVNFYNWLNQQKFPEGYQVLCMNCQFIKEDTRRGNRIL